MPQQDGNPALRSLSVLLGEWILESPQFGGTGRMTVEWLEGGAYLVERSFAPDPAPDSIWVVGGDESMDSCMRSTTTLEASPVSTG